MTEYLDVCTEEGIPAGETVERKTAHSTDVCHRTAHVWIIRKEGDEYQILMQKREEDVDSFPGCKHNTLSVIGKNIVYNGRSSYFQ